MRVRFDAEAADELRAVVEYYESRRPGLGEALEAEIRDAIERVVQAPDRWHVIEGEARRILVRHYPYGIVYVADPGEIYVVAVAHHGRQAGYWTGRMK